MRILIVGKLFPPSTSARALQLANVANALVDAGCEVRVIAELDRQAKKPQLRFPVHYVKSEAAAPRTSPAGLLGRFVGSLDNSLRRRDWWRRAGIEALKVIREFKPDVLLSSSSPYDSHCVVLEIRRRTEIPWIAYFSDPWPPAIMPEPYRESPSRRGRLKTLWEMRLVRKTLQECDALAMGNPYALELMERETGIAVIQKRFAIGHIGSERFNGGGTTNKKLAHIGQLCERRHSPELLTAVKRVATEIPDRFEGLLLVGDVCREFQDLIRQEEMQDMVESAGHLPAARAQELACGAGALLVLEAEMELSPFLPSKFADYAMTGRPVIAITPAVGAIRDYLKMHRGGWAVGRDADQISQAIREAFKGRNAERTEPSPVAQPPISRPFRSENVAKQYLDMCESVLRGRKAKQSS